MGPPWAPPGPSSQGTAPADPVAGTGLREAFADLATGVGWGMDPDQLTRTSFLAWMALTQEKHLVCKAKRNDQGGLICLQFQTSNQGPRA